MKRFAIAVLMFGTMCAGQQPQPVKPMQNINPAPLKCDPEKPGECTNTYITAPVPHANCGQYEIEVIGMKQGKYGPMCIDQLHTVTEKEWQERLISEDAMIKELKALRLAQASQWQEFQKLIKAMQTRNP